MDIKKILKNTLIVFAICFAFWFIHGAYEDYLYYSGYSKEDLHEFFSMKDTLIHIFNQSLYFCFRFIIVIVPIVALLEKTKIRNIFKIIIASVITLVISFIFIIINLRIVF